MRIHIQIQTLHWGKMHLQTILTFFLFPLYEEGKVLHLWEWKKWRKFEFQRPHACNVSPLLFLLVRLCILTFIPLSVWYSASSYNNVSESIMNTKCTITNHHFKLTFSEFSDLLGWHIWLASVSVSTEGIGPSRGDVVAFGGSICNIYVFASTSGCCACCFDIYPTSIETQKRRKNGFWQRVEIGRILFSALKHPRDQQEFALIYTTQYYTTNTVMLQTWRRHLCMKLILNMESDHFPLSFSRFHQNPT